jgi:putative transposase
MPRDARIIPPEGYLHVRAIGNNSRKLFFYPRDFKIYYSLIKKLKNEEYIDILHYCLMSNHVHILLGVRENSNLSRFMKRLNLRYFHYYKKKHSYKGHLWQDRFKSKLVEKDEYMIQCGKYIELNPVRAGIVEVPEEYPYSSCLHYISGLEDEIIDDDPLYLNLSKDATSRQIIYRNMLLKEIGYEL